MVSGMVNWLIISWPFRLLIAVVLLGVWCAHIVGILSGRGSGLGPSLTVEYTVPEPTPIAASSTARIRMRTDPAEGADVRCECTIGGAR